MAKQTLNEMIKLESKYVGELYLLRKLNEKQNKEKNNFVSYLDIIEDLNSSDERGRAVSMLSNLRNKGILDTSYEKDDSELIGYRSYRINNDVHHVIANYVNTKTLK